MLSKELLLEFINGLYFEIQKDFKDANILTLDEVEKIEQKIRKSNTNEELSKLKLEILKIDEKLEKLSKTKYGI